MKGIRVLVRSSLVPLALAFVAPAARGEQVLWRLEAPGGTLVLEGAPGGRTARIARIATIEKPAIATACWAVRGDVSTAGVEGSGYLEMWSVFADGSRYFSRTLGEEGPMARLTGTEARREFVLPFYGKPGLVPARVEVNLVLPGGGRVELTNVTFSQLSPGENPLAPRGAWLTGPEVGLAGGLLGTLLGCAGAIAGVLASRGRARSAVLGLFVALIAAGLSLLAFGVVAAVAGQPAWLWGAALLAGALAAGIPSANLPGLRRRYQETELRRMRSLDPI